MNDEEPFAPDPEGDHDHKEVDIPLDDEEVVVKGDDEDPVPHDTMIPDEATTPSPHPLVRQDDDEKPADVVEEDFLKDTPPIETLDEKTARHMELIRGTEPATPLEHALSHLLQRKDHHIVRLTNEIQKLKAFISKRKQTYKRKRKDEGAPTRALSAYNIFVQDRFAQLAKENEKALKSTDSDAQLKRVPPANLVASTGNQWKELPQEVKAKYEERAKADRKRYDDQMAQYQPPDRASNRKRNKTGYNMFFSAHVLRLKQSETGVPSERGSVARLVGTAWKSLSGEERQYYEREADKHNGMHPVKDDVEEEEDEESKRQQHHHMVDPYAHMHPNDMHMQTMHPQQHDPRHHGGYAYPTHHMYGQPPYGHYDYPQQHPPPPPPQQQQPQHQQHSRHGQSRSHGGGYGHSGYPPSQRSPYEGI